MAVRTYWSTKECERTRHRRQEAREGWTTFRMVPEESFGEGVPFGSRRRTRKEHGGADRVYVHRRVPVRSAGGVLGLPVFGPGPGAPCRVRDHEMYPFEMEVTWDLDYTLRMSRKKDLGLSPEKWGYVSVLRPRFRPVLRPHVRTFLSLTLPSPRPAPHILHPSSETNGR